MFDEVASGFAQVGVCVSCDAESAYAEDGRGLMLVVLCPGFFACSELVEEIAQVPKPFKSPLRPLPPCAPSLPLRSPYAPFAPLSPYNL